MAIFDNPMNDLQGLFDTAAVKTREAVENSKGLVERAKLRNDLNDKYRQLGKAEFEYAVGETDDTDTIDMLVAEISELRQAYADISKVLRKNETPTCTRCGRKNAAGNSYCSNCGAKLYVD